jgi:HD-GYP domain-containing protein (c-di-GMP phosphodiesterase class II)/DNA-binding CsgD family transcriptional regulator
VRAIDVMGAMSLASDMALGLPVGHGVRATYIGMRLADALAIASDQRVDVYYAGLLMDAGCTAWTTEVAALVLGDDIAARRELFFYQDPSDPRDVVVWLAHHMAAGERLDSRLKHSMNFMLHGKEFMVEGMRNTVQTSARLAGRLGRSDGVQDALRFVFERWNGDGPFERRAEAIPIASRIVYASMFVEVFHQLGGREAAIRLARARRGRALDPEVVDAFTRLSDSEEFWRGLEDPAIWTTVREMEPEGPQRHLRVEYLDDAARAFADFADLKSIYSRGHSRRVATLAERMAEVLRLPEPDIENIRRAALVHDIGLVAVPSFVLHKPRERLTPAEWEGLRLHPYHAERILARVGAFESLVPLVSAHHERPDGQGFYRGLSSEQIPTGALIIGVADAFDELTHARPEGAALEPEAAIDVLRAEAGRRFGAAEVEALAACLELPAILPSSPGTQKVAWPAGLTDREIDVLRALATGASRKVMAERLMVSEHTVRHHLEHIYAKIDVSTRVEATLFALEHEVIV